MCFKEIINNKFQEDKLAYLNRRIIKLLSIGKQALKQTTASLLLKEAVTESPTLRLPLLPEKETVLPFSIIHSQILIRWTAPLTTVSLKPISTEAQKLSHPFL